MITRDVILKLLSGEHLYPDERRRLGISKDTVLYYEELIETMADELRVTGCFPSGVEKVTLETREGIYIIKTERGYECRVKRYSPSNSSVVVEGKEITFAEPKDAARFYLKWELNLPGRLDGIEVCMS